jgi:ribosomal protein L37AE/L43A
MDFDPKLILQKKIRLDSARQDRCKAHEFEQTPQEERTGTKIWRCIHCKVGFSGGEIIAYRQGLQHGAEGHDLEGVGTNKFLKRRP